MNVIARHFRARGGKAERGSVGDRAVMPFRLFLWSASLTRGALHPKLLDYLLSIRPANASGLVHPNPATGFAYVDIRKQWDHLIEIASRLLGYRLEGKKADFFNLRHSGASHIAASQRDARHLLGVVWMMGDTSIATVNRHYFNFDEDTLREIIQAWAIPEVVDVYRSFRLPLAS